MKINRIPRSFVDILLSVYIALSSAQYIIESRRLFFSFFLIKKKIVLKLNS